MKVIFCGGCNPFYNRSKVYESIKGLMEEKQRVVILNGCPRACKTKLEAENISTADFFNSHSMEKWNENCITAWLFEKLEESI